MFKALECISKLNRFTPAPIQKRTFWDFVNQMFNKPDPERIKKFGPDRACAEWILRNGGKIVWDNGKILSSFNYLPKEDIPVPRIAEIDATDSGISHYGFGHLEGCTSIRKIILHNASYIDDRALKGLSYRKDTLNFLQISKCDSVSDSGIKELRILQNLSTLSIFDLAGVDNLKECKTYLETFLPNCKIRDAAITD